MLQTLSTNVAIIDYKCCIRFHTCYNVFTQMLHMFGVAFFQVFQVQFCCKFSYVANILSVSCKVDHSPS
jgi:hypothetical protein